MNFIKGIVTKNINDNLYEVEVNKIGYFIEIIENNILLNKEYKIYLYKYNDFNNIENKIYGFLNYENYIFFYNSIVIKGVGPKTILKIINNIELDKFKDMVNNKSFADILHKSKITYKQLIAILKHNNIIHPKQFDKELVNSLSNLGYSKNQIIEAILKVEFTDNLEKYTKEIIKRIEK